MNFSEECMKPDQKTNPDASGKEPYEELEIEVIDMEYEDVITCD